MQMSRILELWPVRLRPHAASYKLGRMAQVNLRPACCFRSDWGG